MGELKVTETEYALLVATTVFFSGKSGGGGATCHGSRCGPSLAPGAARPPPPPPANRALPPCPRRPPAPKEQAARRRAAGAAAGPPLQALEDPPPRGPAALRPPRRAPHGAAHPQPRARGGAGDVAYEGPAAHRPALRGLGSPLGGALAERRAPERPAPPWHAPPPFPPFCPPSAAGALARPSGGAGSGTCALLRGHGKRKAF